MAELVNCDFCGRNTTRRSRICKHCMAGVSKHDEPPEQLPEDRAERLECITRDEEILRAVEAVIKEKIG